MKNKTLIGTRESKLALYQSNLVIKKLSSLYPNISFEIKKIKTKGDILLNHNIESSIDKGFFVKEIQQKLLNKEIDIAIHSLKDLPVDDVSGLEISAILKRDNHKDAFLSNNNFTISKIKKNAVIATSSNRRKSQLLRLNPKFNIISIRGNVDTRISKMRNGYCDGLVLAAAALERLNLKDNIANYFDSDEMLSAPGQGAIAIESRKNDKINQLLSNLNHEETSLCIKQERSFLKYLEGGCTAPIGAYAKIKNEKLILKGIVSTFDGKTSVFNKISSNVNSSSDLGIKLAQLILNNGGKKVLSIIRKHEK